MTIPIRFFRVSDDDGKRESAADVEVLRRQVDFMNKAFKPADVRFTFDAAHDLVPLKSTIVNNMLGTDDANWLKAKREGNRIAAGCHGKLVVFIRHGPGAKRRAAAPSPGSITTSSRSRGLTTEFSAAVPMMVPPRRCCGPMPRPGQISLAPAALAIASPSAMAAAHRPWTSRS